MKDYFDINEIIGEASHKSLNEDDEGVCATCGEVLEDHDGSDDYPQCKVCRELSESL